MGKPTKALHIIKRKRNLLIKNPIDQSFRRQATPSSHGIQYQSFPVRVLPCFICGSLYTCANRLPGSIHCFRSYRGTSFLWYYLNRAYPIAIINWIDLRPASSNFRTSLRPLEDWHYGPSL